MKDPESAEEAREKLSQFAEELRKLSYPTSPIDLDLAEYVTDAITQYIEGNAKSLDAAFGLSPQRGRPVDIGRREAIARKIFYLKLENKSWEEIASELEATQGYHTNERQLRRVYNDFEDKLMAEEITKRLENGHK